MQFHVIYYTPQTLVSESLFTCPITGAKLHLLFWTACNAYTKHIFTRSMEAIKRESKRAYEWLMDEPVEHWARYTFDPEVKCPDNTTNFVESFNGKIEKFRYKPIFTLLEAVRRKFMKTIADRGSIAKQWKGKVVPRVKILLQKIAKESRACRLTPAGRGIYEVIEGATQFTVDINTHCCDCMTWNISGIPCKHAARCILSERLELESFVHEAYSVDRYKQIYDVCMKPIPDPIFWEDRELPKIGPPPIDIKRGRPQTERRRDVTEKRKEYSRSNTLKCSICKQFGHNKRSHREDGVLQILKGKDKPSYQEKRGKRKVGRPRKEGPPLKKSKTAEDPSSSKSTSQTSTSASKKQRKKK